MKSYTDIEQSRKLTEVLPIESADMRYAPFGDTHPWVWDEEVKLLEKGSIPCWSLATLLDIIPVRLNGYKDMVIRLRMDKGDAGPDEYNLWYEDISTGVATSLDVEADSFVDVCYEMILKLHELNLL